MFASKWKVIESMQESLLRSGETARQRLITLLLSRREMAANTHARVEL